MNSRQTLYWSNENIKFDLVLANPYSNHAYLYMLIIILLSILLHTLIMGIITNINAYMS